MRPSFLKPARQRALAIKEGPDLIQTMLRTSTAHLFMAVGLNRAAGDLCGDMLCGVPLSD